MPKVREEVQSKGTEGHDEARDEALAEEIAEVRGKVQFLESREGRGEEIAEERVRRQVCEQVREDADVLAADVLRELQLMRERGSLAPSLPLFLPSVSVKTFEGVVSIVLL